MRILHTSDWHLGKKLEDRPRLNEQKVVLNSLVSIADSYDVDIVVISGDVYDTFTPPAEAEKLFFDTLYSLNLLGVAVVVISGNHDDPTRLAAAKKLTFINGVFFSDGEDVSDVQLKKVRLIKGGKDHLVFEDKKGEKVYMAMLPYPTEARMKEASNDAETYEDKVVRYIDSALKNNVEKLPCVLAAHIFMLGGTSSSSERPIELGGARMVSPGAIPEEVVYTALGHLHKRQVVDGQRNIFYSGSILQNAFDECGYKKSVTVFDIEKGVVKDVTDVELEGYCKLERIQADGFSDAMNKLSLIDDVFVELTLVLDKPMTSEETKTLVSTYPKVVIKTRLNAASEVVGTRKLMSDKQLFTEFYRSQYGSEPEKEMVDLFLELVSEIEGEAL